MIQTVPFAAPRSCRESGCPELVTNTRPCPRHPLRPASPRADWYAAYGGRYWIGIRRAVLLAEPYCRHCRAAGRMTFATEADHVVPKREGGTDDAANLQALCHACHVRKTASERAAIARAGARQK